MVKRTVESELRANVGPYVAGMDKAKAATEGLADTQAKASESTDKLGGKALSQSESWKTVSTGLIGAGTAAAAFGLALPTVAASNFEAAMAQVSATGPVAKQRLSELAVVARESATDIDGAGYSAVQAAGGIEALIKAGVSVDDVMGGAMAGSLSLAAAGQMDVAVAAEAAASAMTQFKLSGKDVPHIADLLAAGAGKAQGDVSDLTQALSQSGLVASQFGLSLEDTVGTLSAFASAGLLGSDAGTSLRTMLLRLGNPSGEAATEMERLGIAAYDAQGNFVGVSSVAEQLQTKLGGLDQATRDAALATIFGSDAIRAANVLYEQGAEGMDGWIAAVDDSGYAADVAGERLNSLQGDLQKLWGVLGEVGIAAGEANTGPLRGLVQVLTDLLRAASENPAALQVAAISIGVLGAAVAAFGITMKITTSIVEFREAVGKIRGSAKDAETGLDGATKATGKWSKALGAAAGIAAAGGLLIFLGNLRNSLLATATGAEEAEASVTRFVNGTGNLDKVFQRSDGSGIWESARGGVDDLSGALKALSDGTPQWSNRYKAVAEQFDLIDQSLANMDPDQADAAAAANGSGELSFEQLVAMLSGGIPVVEEAAAAADTHTAALEAEQVAADEAKASSEQLAQKLGEIAQADSEFVGPMEAYDKLIQANKDAAQAAADSTESSEDSWENYIDQHGFQVDEYMAQLRTMVEAQSAWETNMLTLAGQVSDGTLEYLSKLGPEGAPLVAELVKMSGAELAEFDDLFANAGADATGAFAGELETARSVWSALMAKGGASAVAAAKAEVASGKAGLQDIINRYGLTIKIGVDKSGYWDAMNTLNSINGKTVTTYVAIKKYGQGALASGGYAGHLGLAAGGNPGFELARRYYTGSLVEGPGTTTSDSIPAWLSRKEFVHNADATDYYGVPFMYALNRKAIPREFFRELGFAGGGTPSAVAPARLALTPAASGGAGPAVHRHYNVTVPKDAFRSWNAFEAFLSNIDHHAELAGGPR